MHPVLLTGDRVELRPVERAEIRCGDILVFTAADGRRIIHRVIRTAPLQTRGDNCSRDDLPVPEDSPLFHAFASRRNGENVPLSAGAEGMREFRRDQFRCRVLGALRSAAAFCAVLNPFKLPFRKLAHSEFPGKTVYYAGKHPVGWRDSSGWHWMPFARFFVQSPPEESPHEH